MLLLVVLVVMVAFLFDGIDAICLLFAVAGGGGGGVIIIVVVPLVTHRVCGRFSCFGGLRPMCCIDCCVCTYLLMTCSQYHGGLQAILALQIWRRRQDVAG